MYGGEESEKLTRWQVQPDEVASIVLEDAACVGEAVPDVVDALRKEFDADTAPPHALCNDESGAETGEGIQHEIVGKRELVEHQLHELLGERHVLGRPDGTIPHIRTEHDDSIRAHRADARPPPRLTTTGLDVRMRGWHD